MDWLGGLALADLGATALVTLVVLMILTDRLVTKARLTSAEKLADTWQSAYEQERAARQERDAQLLTVLPHYELVSRVLSTALPPPPQDEDRGKG